MPPQLTFIQLTNELTIPIKLFIKKYENSKTAQSNTSNIQSLSINEVSPITIHNITTLKLSSNQISSIVDKITPLIKPIVYDVGKQVRTYDLKIDNLKCVVPVDVIIQIRFRLRLIDYEEAKKSLSDSFFNTMIKDQTFSSKKEEETEIVFNVEETDEPLLNPDDIVEITDEKINENQEEEEVVDDKKNYSNYSLKGKSIVGDFTNCIKVYVY
ncbi:hypothetical protein KGF54_001444 [Candida jiufengensis]|uniref:uncharacterized protein n=1 Tax=Candida jiufengensis TaxID=497108 RepID=UPI0022251D1E|nr:uncharacterized protein KGF54_001444 [Candida jiufengensis]KAI5955942.1 hypothetical protein KGF54_001444 [Candida jiufengensis]